MTGLRPGEVLGLTVDDLDFAEKLIHVNRSGWFRELLTTKTKSSKKPVPMPEPLEEILRKYLGTWRENTKRLLFVTRRGNPYSRNKVVQTRLRPILNELKIPRGGMHAQEQLRHSDVSITMNRYVHSIDAAQRESAENVAATIVDGNGRKSEANSRYIKALLTSSRTGSDASGDTD